MMDSQEKALEQGTQEMEKVVTSVNEPENIALQESVEENTTLANNDTEENTSVRKNYNSKEEILARITEIVAKNENPQKDEIDYLKTTFYKIHLAEREASMKEYLDGGGDPEQYKVMPDPNEEAFKAQMQVVKERRAQLFQQQEEEKQENLKKKLDIIEQIKGMATSPDAANKAYHEFKELQQQWKEIKAVPADKASELWRNYHLYVEQFYDLLKLNHEAREYDFKKNLELKEKLCEAAEKLADEADVVSAFHQLQELHAEYREIGPVAKDLREQIWTRFKAASTVVNKRHQQHFEALRATEEENLTKKTALCEKVEAIKEQVLKTANDWETKTKEIIDIQNEWKTIGFAPQKMNVKIFERFRGACDDFFTRKAEYFKELKKLYAENAQKKRELVEKAQALADSTDWKSTGDTLIALQKEWKTIGMVPRKLGDQLWNDFLTACNKFFDARNEAHSGTRNAERDNLAKKRDIIQQLKAMLEDTVEDAQEKVRELVDAYNKTGHVPFKDKDKLYEEYRETVDSVYKKLNMSMARKRLDDFKTNLKNVAKRGADAIDNERGKLMHRYESLKQEIITYENNLGFLNASSKKGNSLLDEMNRKVQKLKDELELVKQKVKEIDRQNKEAE
ncbi:MAG: DUF349 domain-containing protein [Prevotella sp.]|nr:DUF349 domain-containing protein [Prevotellaceae bacterium]MDY3365557.1 DUF349 domain-containing protein [Prevotella sp.]MDY3853321.1 DUF349 domain-containing protein [Prevotella sp.]